MPGGDRRRGPIQDSGLARSLHCGSVSTETPSSSTSTVAWPTHVTTAPCDDTGPRRLATARGAVNVRGETMLCHTRRERNDQRVQASARR